MMQAKRIIPCLDVDDGRVVKGVKFRDIQDAGDPVELAKRYNDDGAVDGGGQPLESGEKRCAWRGNGVVNMARQGYH